MPRFFMAASLAIALWPAAARALPPDPPPDDTKSAPAAQSTLGAWAAMDASITRQRAAVCHQVRAPEARGVFFILPPPDPLRPILTLPGTGAPDCPALGEAELTPLVEEAARQAGVEPGWLGALVARKSGGRPCAISPAGAAGLLQLMPATAREFGVADPFDARENLAAGARRLKQLLDRAGGDPAAALALYDADSGPERSRDATTNTVRGAAPPAAPAVPPAAPGATPAAAPGAPPAPVPNAAPPAVHNAAPRAGPAAVPPA